MSRPLSSGQSIPPELLLRAYANGVFPMAENADDPEVFWVRPDIRGIIPLDEFRVPRSLGKLIRQNRFDIVFDGNFDGVISGCAETKQGRTSTWINQSIRTAYKALFDRGYCHTVEAWHDNRLVGGLYGVSLGAAFFGESMFSRERDASKVCLFHLVKRLNQQHFQLLDTQFTTEHLKRFGAIDIPRDEYETMLEKAIAEEAEFNPPGER